MPATHRQVNWTAVGFTPSGGTASPATGVTQIQINPNGNLIKFSGDADHGPTTIVNDFVDNEIVVTTADEIWALALPPGTRGTLVATHKDAKSAVGGNIVFTLVNAIVVDNTAGGQHRQFGQSAVRFHAEWADSVTNPLSFALS